MASSGDGGKAAGADTVAELLKSSSEAGKKGFVEISYGLVSLLSEQLYQSPSKAIEELVVNAYDADAGSCWLRVPDSATIAAGKENEYLAVFDDGHGMGEDELLALWTIGVSAKKVVGFTGKKRKYIGKFGIGKLATYAVGRRLTYISRVEGGPIQGVTVDFRDFEGTDKDRVKRIALPVWKVKDATAFRKTPMFSRVLSDLGLPVKNIDKPHWTLAIVEDLKPRASDLRSPKLRWILGTALPLSTAFSVRLNGDEVKSSKESGKKYAYFKISDLPATRLANLLKLTGVEWKSEKGALVSKTFPSGIRGHAFVSRKSLRGKSEDLGRSYGFFVKVNGRLVNESDEYFGIQPKTFEVWYNFHALIEADDLNSRIMASREVVEDSVERTHLQAVLGEIFNEARTLYTAAAQKEEDKSKTKKEEVREYLPRRMVEEPIADALVSPAGKGDWFYLELAASADRKKLVEELYDDSNRQHSYRYEKLGPNSRLFRYDPETRVFDINDDHEFVREHSEDPRARLVLEDMVTAELLLEAHLRRAGSPDGLVSGVLSSRDLLLRNLTKDRRYSLKSIAASLRDAAKDEHDLEVALVAAARTLGFVAQHVSGAGQPDGIARFMDFPGGETRIVLEAKSSDEVPSLGAIDFAGLRSHVVKQKAQGCLLLAPSYPGSTKLDNEASLRARQQKVSCWTIAQLASVVENSESRRIGARAVRDIVLTAFSPEEVAVEVNKLLAEPAWKHQDLHTNIMKGLRILQDTAPDSAREPGMLVGVLAAMGMKGVKKEEVRAAMSELAAASKGAAHFRPDTEDLLIHTSLDELENRLAAQLGKTGAPRKKGPFR